MTKINKILVIAIIQLVSISMYGNQKTNVDSLINLYKRTTVDSIKAKIAIDISLLYSNNQPDKALQYSQDAILLAEKTKKISLISSSYYNAGLVHFEAGLLEVSVKHFYKYLNIAKSTNNKQAITNALVNISAIKLAANQYDSAEVSLLQTLDFMLDQYKQNPDTITATGLTTVYNNLGIISIERNENLQAIKYYQEGLKYIGLVKNRSYNEANLLNNLGKAYVLEGKYPEAYEAINRALELRLEQQNIFGTASSYRNLALYYEKQHFNSQAIKSYQKALLLAKEIRNNSLIEGIYEGIFNNYYNSNNADSALKYHLLFKEQSELVSREVINKEITKIELTNQFEQRQKQQIDEQKRRELRYLYVGIILILGVLIAILLYVISQSRLRRLKLENTNTELSNKNLQLQQEQLKSELEIKNKELTTSVLHQIQHNDLIDKIVQRLLNTKSTFTTENSKVIKEVIRDLERSRDKSIWEEFEIRFQQAHNEFFTRLNAINPNLTNNERRLCAFLRLNMTSKEISSITGSSLRSIEVARTRLRKKLELTNTDQGLVGFISSL